MDEFETRSNRIVSLGLFLMVLQVPGCSKRCRDWWVGQWAHFTVDNVCCDVGVEKGSVRQLFLGQHIRRQEGCVWVIPFPVQMDVPTTCGK
jgi:hypothetical protein